MLILLLILWIVVIPALVVSVTCYGAMRRHSSEGLGQPEAAQSRARLRSRLAALARPGLAHPTH